MKSDIQIAQEAKMKNIREIAAELNLSEDDIDEVTVEEVHGTEKLSLIFSSIFRGYVQ